LSFATSSADSCSFPLSSSTSAFSFLVSASLLAAALIASDFDPCTCVFQEQIR
jgi:hypothetical protein